MENHEQVRFVQTNPRIPSSLGTLNVIFGAILLLYALGSVAWTIGAPIVTAHIFGQTEAARLREKTERKASLADLKKRETAETSVAKKAELKQEIAALETAINLEFGDDEDEREQNDLRLTVPYWVDTILGLLLSVLMIVSGAWLMSLRERGRTLALWVAGIKLVWLIVNFGYALTVTIPLSVEIMSADIVRQE